MFITKDMIYDILLKNFKGQVVTVVQVTDKVWDLVKADNLKSEVKETKVYTRIRVREKLNEMAHERRIERIGSYGKLGKYKLKEEDINEVNSILQDNA